LIYRAQARVVRRVGEVANQLDGGIAFEKVVGLSRTWEYGRIDVPFLA
jgi:hypothetical protein